MASVRLPAVIEVSALIRQVETAGGFAAVIARGEADAGTILVVLTERGRPARAFERLPDASGKRRWHLARGENPEDPAAFEEYLQRRRRQDDDLWIIELDIAQGERFIGLDESLG